MLTQRPVHIATARFSIYLDTLSKSDYFSWELFYYNQHETVFSNVSQCAYTKCLKSLAAPGIFLTNTTPADTYLTRYIIRVTIGHAH